MPTLLYTPSEQPDLTYADVFLVPTNPLLTRLKDHADPEETRTLERLQAAADVSREASERADGQDPTLAALALEKHRQLRACMMALAGKYPDAARVESRDDVDFTPLDGFGTLPIVVANMNAVAGKRMAEAMAMMGGSAAIPQDKTDEEMKEIAGYMHSRDVRYMTPVIATPKTKAHELRMALDKRDLDTAVVTHEDGRFLGLVKMEANGAVEAAPGVVPRGINMDMAIGGFVRTDCITAKEGVTHEEAVRIMDENRVHILPVLKEDGTVKGVITRKFAGMQWRYHPHVDAANGGLAMLATVGAVNRNPADRVKFLLDLGVSGIVFDTAHFDQGIETYRNVETAARIIAAARQKVLLVAGNEVTAQATRDIIAAGADVAKVGVGPGRMCTTRIETGVGRPQFSAVLECATAARAMGKHVWADGGIQDPRDVALALAAGASQVMIGSLFTPTLESPAPLEKDDRGVYGVNHGMASRQAATLRNIGRVGTDMRSVFRSVVGQRAEGISAGKVYQKPGMRSVVDYVHALMDGVTSSMTYAGARNLDEFRRYATVGLQTAGGFEEGKPKHVS